MRRLTEQLHVYVAASHRAWDTRVPIHTDRVKDLTSVGSLVLSEGASFLPPQCKQLVIHPRTHTSNVHQW